VPLGRGMGLGMSSAGKRKENNCDDAGVRNWRFAGFGGFGCCWEVSTDSVGGMGLDVGGSSCRSNSNAKAKHPVIPRLRIEGEFQAQHAVTSSLEA